MPVSHAFPEPAPIPSTVPIMRVNGPAALVQAVPYLLGFHPSHSIVVVGLREAQLVVTARLDLPVPDGRRPPTGDLTHAIAVLLRSGVTEIVAIVFSERGECGDHAAVLASLAGAVATGGARLADVLLVCQGRWRSLLCDDELCCPAGGRRLDEQTSEFAAAATFAGVVAHPDRDSLAAILQPGEARARAAVGALIAEIERQTLERATPATGRDRRATRGLFAAARAADADFALYSTEPADEDVARMAVWLGDIEVRDSVWMGIDDGRLDGRPLWAALARRVPHPYDAAPAFLYGWAAWRAGNGAMASVAAQRAVSADPAYSAADLLLGALSRGIDPRSVPKLRRARR